jgi:thiamine pyrophosphate-dependent acetolactate synthase large subunit-like protein
MARPGPIVEALLLAVGVGDGAILTREHPAAHLLTWHLSRLDRGYGRPSCTTLGPIDPVKYAESFGAHGFMIQSPDQIPKVLKQAFDTHGPVLMGVHVDYRDNHKLFEQVNERSIH